MSGLSAGLSSKIGADKLKKLNTTGNARWWPKGAIQKIFGNYDDGEASCKQFLIRICFGFVVRNCKQCALQPVYQRQGKNSTR